MKFFPTNGIFLAAHKNLFIIGGACMTSNSIAALPHLYGAGSGTAFMRCNN
jgi:hypothetical protein